MGRGCGRRIRAAVDAGCGRAERESRIVRRGDFIWLPDMTTAPLRDRSELPDSSKKAERIAREELKEASVKAVSESYGMQRDEIPPAVLRLLLGFRRTTKGAPGMVSTVVDGMVDSGRLSEDGGHGKPAVWPGRAMNAWKPVVLYSKGKPECELFADALWVGAPGAKEGHPLAQPGSEVEPLIRAFSNDGDLVVDPFCGSGTVPIAAEKLERRALGCDVSEIAHRTSVERMALARKALQDKRALEEERVS